MYDTCTKLHLNILYVKKNLIRFSLLNLILFYLIYYDFITIYVVTQDNQRQYVYNCYQTNVMYTK